MTEDLRLFLVDNASPELYDIILKAFEILDEMYPPSIQLKFQSIVFEQDVSTNDTGDTLAYIVRLVKVYLFQILNEHDIAVDADIDLFRLTNIVEGLLQIATYEDKETILSILELEENSEEKFSEVLSLVCEYDHAEILLMLESVSQALLDKIKEELLSDGPLVFDQSVTDPEDYIKEIEQFEHFSPIPELICIGMLKSNVNVGYPFEVYANIIGRDLEVMEIDRAANELVAMALISIDGKSNPKLVINKYIANYVSDLRKITMIDIKVTELLVNFQKYKDSKRTTITEHK